MPRRTTRRARGFTIVEMLFVVTLILTLTMLAFPSLKTFSARDADASIATFLTHEFNRVKAQAQMRNRAYVVRFSDFSADTPRGRMEVFEGNGPSCADAMADLNANARRLANYGLGATPILGQPGWDSTPGGVDPVVGFGGYVLPGGNLGAPERNLPLVLCARPDGALQRPTGLLDGRVTLLVQRYYPGQNQGPAGPARRVRFDFTQPARLELN